jgi:hypothetical protein
MPIYEYEHPETGEIFEELRSVSDRDRPFIAPDGIKCNKVMASSFGIVNGNADIADYDEVLKNKPKYLRFKDGHRERFDPTKHGHAAGSAYQPPKKPFRRKKKK